MDDERIKGILEKFPFLSYGVFDETIENTHESIESIVSM